MFFRQEKQKHSEGEGWTNSKCSKRRKTFHPKREEGFSPKEWAAGPFRKMSEGRNRRKIRNVKRKEESVTGAA